LPHEIAGMFVESFRAAHKLKRKSKVKLLRDEQYEGDTVYYRNKDFNFIVQNNIIITVEFNGRKKHLNKVKPKRREFAGSRG
jgi:hypothetical protein